MIQNPKINKNVRNSKPNINWPTDATMNVFRAFSIGRIYIYIYIGSGSGEFTMDVFVRYCVSNARGVGSYQ